VVEREDVEVEPEEFARGDSAPIQMTGTEYERAGPVGKAAGSGPGGGGFEDTGVRAGVAHIAGSGVGAMGDAGDAAEDDTEGAAQNVGGFAWGEEERLFGDEVKAEGIKTEIQYRVIIQRDGKSVIFTTDWGYPTKTAGFGAI
jgi:hypothetical protein